MSPGAKTVSRGGAGWAWAGIFLVTLLAYFPAIGAGFIWNDSDYVTKPALRSLHGLGRIWFELGATEQYYPLLHSAFWVEHRLWGDAPLGYHLVNILLHATSACLFGVLLSRLGWGDVSLRRPFGSEESKRPTASNGRRGDTSPHLNASLFAALLFALHPVCVESVAWISEQKNTLSTVFYLLSALAYFNWRERSRPSSYWLAAGLFVLALLTKSVTATLPAALLVVVWWREGRLSWRRDFAPLLPWLVLGAASGLFSGWVERTYVGAQGSAFTLNLLERGLLAGRATWFYLGKLLWPANLIFIYPRWSVSGAEGWQYLFPLALLALAAVLWRIRGWSRAPLAAFLFFAGSLFPTLGFFNLFAFIYSYVADHWQYLPSLGIFALAAGAWGRWREAGGQKTGGRKISPFPPARMFSVVVLTVLGVLTWRQCGMYNDIETFYDRTIEKNPACWMAHYNLGVRYVRAGRLEEGFSHYRRAVEIKPDLDVLRSDFGAALVRAGRLPEAITQFRASVRANPNYAVGHLNLGAALNQTGQPEAAIAECREALRLQPDYAEANFNLALAYQSTGRMNEAIAQFQAGLQRSPGDAVARDDLGVLLAQAGRVPEAEAQFARVLQLHPDDREAREVLAQLRAMEPGANRP